MKGEYLSLAQTQSVEQSNLLARRNVVGIAISHKIKNEKDTGDPCLTIYVESKLDKNQIGADDLIPATIGNFKTDVVESGTIMAGSLISTSRRQRPVQGGLSVGHFKITAGTIATCVSDISPLMGITNRYYILSNNHVLANTNNANLGDPILQPGPYDGGQNPEDVVAKLARFVPIDFSVGANNLVDAAIAEGDFNDLNREINWIGYCNGIVTANIGQKIQKCGRTTAYTTGKVTAINATVNVNYGGGKVGRFVNQIITSEMSAGGDSGSLVLDMKNQAVGLLFAGSSTITIINPIKPVMSSLGIKFI